MCTWRVCMMTCIGWPICVAHASIFITRWVYIYMVRTHHTSVMDNIGVHDHWVSIYACVALRAFRVLGSVCIGIWYVLYVYNYIRIAHARQRGAWVSLCLTTGHHHHLVGILYTCM